MKIRQWIVDAFAERVFEGNPAAVCLPDSWPSDETMYHIAKENNLSETAFAVQEPDGWRLRWFTPTVEIDLCGHATLATAYVVLNELGESGSAVEFNTRSGKLGVAREENRYYMDLPAYQLKPSNVTPQIANALGVEPLEVWMGRDMVCVLPTAEDVLRLTPNLEKPVALDGLLRHTTARGTGQYDCVSRSFAPKCGIAEDPVCGSGHCHLIPYWYHQLKKRDILAWQASSRGGTLYCQMKRNRVRMGGACAVYSRGEIWV